LSQILHKIKHLAQNSFALTSRRRRQQ